jgi:hypothetical protein
MIPVRHIAVSLLLLAVAGVAGAADSSESRGSPAEEIPRHPSGDLLEYPTQRRLHAPATGSEHKGDAWAGLNLRELKWGDPVRITFVKDTTISDCLSQRWNKAYSLIVARPGKRDLLVKLDSTKRNFRNMIVRGLRLETDEYRISRLTYWESPDDSLLLLASLKNRIDGDAGSSVVCLAYNDVAEVVRDTAAMNWKAGKQAREDRETIVIAELFIVTLSAFWAYETTFGASGTAAFTLFPVFVILAGADGQGWDEHGSQALRSTAYLVGVGGGVIAYNLLRFGLNEEKAVTPRSVRIFGENMLLMHSIWAATWAYSRFTGRDKESSVSLLFTPDGGIGAARTWRF